MADPLCQQCYHRRGFVFVIAGILVSTVSRIYLMSLALLFAARISVGGLLVVVLDRSCRRLHYERRMRHQWPRLSQLGDVTFAT